MRVRGRNVATGFAVGPEVYCPGKGGALMVVYLDGVMGLNFLVDWLLLLGVNRMSGFPPELGRTAAAAAMGGGYAGMCLVPGFGFLGNGLWRSVSLGVMSMTAFGMDRSALRRGVLFVVLSMALGGLALSMDTGRFPELVACAGVLAVLCKIGFRGKAGAQQFHTVQISHNGRKVTVNALTDTGNTLRDPLTGEAVLVADARMGEALLGLSAEELADPVGTLGKNPELGLRLIPYRTVGQKGQFLLGLRCDQVTVDGATGGRLVAFSPQQFGEEYRALMGGQAWEK